MNLKEIRQECWDLARDTAEDDEFRLWTKAEMNRYINRTYRKIAAKTRCIRDARTDAVCRIASAPPADLAALTTLALTDPWAADDLARYNNTNSWLYHSLAAPNVYPLHPSIIDIDEVKWTNWQWRLTKVSVTKWQWNPLWEEVIGMPTEFATDYHNSSIALNFRHNAQETLRLTVRRMPLVPLANDTDIPEFRVNYHELMINDILSQMYSKQDAQTNDQKKADQFAVDFAADLDQIKQEELILDQRLKANNSLDAFR